MEQRPGPRTRTDIVSLDGDVGRARNDELATEEPLELRLHTPATGRSTLAITMRTPGSDFELAAGYLVAEGVVRDRADIRNIRYCTDPDVDGDQRYNVVTVDLAREPDVDLRHLQRHVTTSSACGVCGAASLDALELRGVAVIDDDVAVSTDVLYGLPDGLRAAQGVFDRTGGLHAAGLFTPDGVLVAAREDIGRHNAVDKLVGWALLEARLPLRHHILAVSGRAGYEIVQKAVTARIPVVAAISAPSSLAVDLARRFDQTLVGFLRERRANLYAGAHRVRTSTEQEQPWQRPSTPSPTPSVSTG